MRLSQDLKQSDSIVSTLVGIISFVIPAQLENAEFPKVLTPFSKLSSTIFIQFAYLQPIITQYFIDNKSEIWLLFLIAHSKR